MRRVYDGLATAHPIFPQIHMPIRRRRRPRAPLVTSPCAFAFEGHGFFPIISCKLQTPCISQVNQPAQRRPL